MKLSFKIAGSILAFGFLFSFTLKAQECNAALFLKEGNVLEYTSYSKKGKPISIATHETLSLKEEGNKLTAVIKIISEDVKGKDSFTSEYEASCEDGLFSLDMARFFDTSKLQQYDTEKFSIDMQGDVLEFPAHMSAGEAMNDGSITVKVSKDEFVLITMIFNITNRKIIGNETITTKAGTFDCQKVTFDFDSKFGIIKVQGSGIEWYQKDRVVVKSESYNKKGKLIGSTELTRAR